MNGVLVIDKPAGLTSADVVARVRRGLGERRVGHTGTLDPMATGVLPVVVGEATKIAGFLLADDKAYEGAIELGWTTDTLDREGKVIARDAADAIAAATPERIRAAATALVGTIQQVPPAVSAIRQGGKRLYELARRGETVEVAAREVHVESFELTAIDGPQMAFRVACSKGTYVRSLARDLGAALGLGATLTALRRTRAGDFTEAHAIPLADVATRGREALLSPAAALGGLARLTLGAAEVARVRLGQRLAAPDGLPEGPLCLLDEAGTLVALAENEAGRVSPRRVLLPENSI